LTIFVAIIWGMSANGCHAFLFPKGSKIFGLRSSLDFRVTPMATKQIPRDGKVLGLPALLLPRLAHKKPSAFGPRRPEPLSA
jgi:hypothetical protein